MVNKEQTTQMPIIIPRLRSTTSKPGAGSGGRRSRGSPPLRSLRPGHGNLFHPAHPDPHSADCLLFWVEEGMHARS